MLDLFQVPQIQLPKADFVHRIYDTNDFPKRTLEDKSTEVYKQRLARQREKYRQGRGIAKL